MPSGTRDTVVSSERRDLCRTAGATNRGERGGMPVELLALAEKNTHVGGRIALGDCLVVPLHTVESPTQRMLHL